MSYPPAAGVAGAAAGGYDIVGSKPVTSSSGGGALIGWGSGGLWSGAVKRSGVRAERWAAQR
jgi:hypothetical protein